MAAARVAACWSTRRGAALSAAVACAVVFAGRSNTAIGSGNCGRVLFPLARGAGQMCGGRCVRVAVGASSNVLPHERFYVTSL